MKRMQKLLIAILIIMISGTFSMAYRHENKIKRTFTINPEGALRLKTDRGDISVSTYDGNEIKVEIIIFSDNNTDIDKMDIQFEPSDETLTIYTPNNQGTENVDIDYYLKLPITLSIVQISTLSGEIKAKGIYKHLIFTTFHGDIELEGLFSACELTTTNGEIEVYQEKALNGSITAKSTNGSIKLTLNEKADFTILGQTVTGDIRSEFNTGIINKLSGSQINGTVNNGTFKINLESINGDLRLNKR